MRQRFAVVALVVVSVVLTAHVSEVRLGALFDSEGSANAKELLAGLTAPDFSPDFLARIAKLSLESLFIGVLGTALAVLVGFVLAMMATRVPHLPDPPRGSPLLRVIGEGFRFLVRLLLSIFRSIPDIIWAYIFVRLLGLGPGPAVLALGVSVGGIIGKLFAELAEATDPEPVHALRRAGVGRLGILLHCVLPQVGRQWIGYALFRLECSIRSASILGVVGAGGLGSEIALSVRYFQYDKLATALLAVLVFVVAMELLSAWLRRQRVWWTLGSAAVGTLVAIAHLDIPWSDIWSASLLPDGISSLIHRGPDALAFIRESFLLVLQTVSMAWCATISAALVAFAAAPLAAATMTVGSHLRDSPRGGGRWTSRISLLGVRLFLQVCRAMPELTLALIFIVWVGPGAFAGVLAVALHTVGVLGRLYTDVYEEVERGPVSALESTGASRLGLWLYGVIPQVGPRLIAFTLYRFEVNVRATAMVGFVGAGGIGDAIHTAISLFHLGDLVLLLAVLVGVVTVIDWAGDRLRHRVLTARFGVRAARRRRRVPGKPQLARHTHAELVAPSPDAQRHQRHATSKQIYYRRPGEDALQTGWISGVSEGGTYIHTHEPLSRGLLIEVLVAPRGAKREEQLERCSARVAYVQNDPEPGMGVVFLDSAPCFLSLVGVPKREPEEAARVRLAPATAREPKKGQPARTSVDVPPDAGAPRDALRRQDEE